MVDPKDDPPIPTYEEATSSTERHGLLANLARRNRSSMDTLDGLSHHEEDEDTDSDDDEGLRREVEQMDIADIDELEEGGRRRHSKGWLGTFIGFKRRLGRWRPRWLDEFGFSGTSYMYSRLSFPNLPTFPQEYRPGLPIVARLLGLFLIIGLGYALFVFELLPNARNKLGGLMFDQEAVRVFAQDHVNGSRVEEYLKHITSFDHMAGTEGSLYLAKWMQGIFWDVGMDDVRLDEYYVYLNYPKPGGRRVAIVEPPELAWEAQLEENPIYTGEKGKDNTMVFHGLSRAGNVKGPLVYANYGSREEYKRLYDSGVAINGSIALVRYYGDQGDRALKVKAAEEWGVRGVLIYSDPEDDGFVKGKPWPEGRWRPSDGVQRGTVGLTSWVTGDVLTPGWASTKDAKRISKDKNPGLVNIPSLPLSWKDAQKLLQSLKGHGQPVPEEWQGGVPDTEYWSGDQSSPIVNLKNEQEEIEKQPIFNLVGRIDGIEASQKKIIVGNHRDAWCFGSADPGSGTAVMLEVMNVFKHLRMQGWRPLRTIEFISWDAEEYNIIGSTEHVEDHIEELRRDGIAYLNVDVGVSGSNFWASASPLFKEAIYRVLGRITDPVKNETLLSLWKSSNSKVTGLGAGSDYLAFQDIAGVSSLDFGFEDKDPNSFPYHSCYETFEWMMKYGDPGLEYHKLLVQVWTLLIIELSGELVLRLDLNEYAAAVASYIQDLQRYSESQGAPWGDEKGHGGFDVKALHEASRILTEKAAYFHSWENWWDQEFYGRGGLETNALALQRMVHNAKLSRFETDLLDVPDSEKGGEGHGVGGFFTALIKGGLSSHPKEKDKEDGEKKADDANAEAAYAAGEGRTQFKHVIHGPAKWNGYASSTFPWVRDAIDDGDWTRAQAELDKAARILKRAAERLTD